MRISYGIRGKRLSANAARRSMWPDAPPSDFALVPPLNVARRSAVGFSIGTAAQCGSTLRRRFLH
ncbi:MAG: hypothetical protein R3C09_17610 [Pirellulaceae bacterium]